MEALDPSQDMALGNRFSSRARNRKTFIHSNHGMLITDHLVLSLHGNYVVLLLSDGLDGDGCSPGRHVCCSLTPLGLWVTVTSVCEDTVQGS
ncbi:hypothetical protein PoB_002211000 [Plakobranchus ocellatus]|uniref:PPM-type phosphatase domain-containing protein n=1 Tax=Plakobranchus ocellatus TaxID=259542 RepID=A0AAV3ZM28_9GAST|nr:hypothetical protein PoB_002211000 [Plakobranchus ocellatus]